ncbi:MAG: hypothetical protein AB7N91_05790 [Candidatus Tectimicrobiota bacterium]
MSSAQSRPRPPLCDAGNTRMGLWPGLYCCWATLAIGLALALAGLSAESLTRLLVLAFLGSQMAACRRLAHVLPGLPPRRRFIVLGTVLAAVVEGLHMISAPVFLSLRIGWETSVSQGLLQYALDLLFTVPVYVVIFAVIWRFIQRYQYTLWHYVLVMGLAQTLGDGGLVFWYHAPAMLAFLPYPMTNYHAINVLPFLAVRAQLPPERQVSRRAYLAIPALMVTYFVCGALIKVLGQYAGLA